MPRYLSLFKYTPEARKGFLKEKAAAREAALTIESAGGKLELFNWTVPGSDYSGNITIAEFPDASTYTAVVTSESHSDVFGNYGCRASHSDRD
jgi:uncharacterized protein with GYD domain